MNSSSMKWGERVPTSRKSLRVPFAHNSATLSERSVFVGSQARGLVWFSSSSSSSNPAVVVARGTSFSYDVCLASLLLDMVCLQELSLSLSLSLDSVSLLLSTSHLYRKPPHLLNRSTYPTQNATTRSPLLQRHARRQGHASRHRLGSMG